MKNEVLISNVSYNDAPCLSKNNHNNNDANKSKKAKHLHIENSKCLLCYSSTSTKAFSMSSKKAKKGRKKASAYTNSRQCTSSLLHIENKSKTTQF